MCAKNDAGALLILAGVCGSGKTTIGKALAAADASERYFIDADDLVRAETAHV